MAERHVRPRAAECDRHGRQQFGQPLASLQLVQLEADMAMQTESSAW